jgi:uncharacterized protein with GYD domain
MPHYLIAFRQAPEAWSALIQAPEDRRDALRATVEAAGGTLHGLWYSFGAHDGYVLVEYPDNVAAASAILPVVASGAFTYETTVLLTVEETVAALERARSLPYRKPGA